MAITLAANLAPAGGQSFYLLEDVYIKGGLQVQDDVAARDKISVYNLKLGALVLTVKEGKIWKVKTLSFPSEETPDAEEKVEWEELALGGGSGGDGSGGTGGGVVGTKKRLVAIKTIEGLRTGQSVQFNMKLAMSSIWLKVEVSRPVRVSAFGDGEMLETNPYMFQATADHLIDDGTMLFEDGTKFRSRNFSILANMDATPSDNIYFIVDNVDDNEEPAILTITYLPLEYAPEEGKTTDTGTETPETTPGTGA